MYLAHFNLSERPFSITPDPRFVYFSERHREALAHLMYGLGEGGGFVQLTGEVGTGKTTICRTLLRKLPGHVDVALIFNSQLSVPELFESLFTELKIKRPGRGASVKGLVDQLYEHLLDANARGRRTILIIDEAQNLGSELLEEIRLLTNLETDQTKLLQVFLVGQPELRDKLQSMSLRQVAQRITARYHLEPLNLAETRHYISHRLTVAGCPYPVFSAAAVRRVHSLSGGIPRRINILCDRALLGAYTRESRRVSAAMVRRASSEVEGRPAASPWPLLRFAGLSATLAIALSAGIHAVSVSPYLPAAAQWMDQAAAKIRVATTPGRAPHSAALALETVDLAPPHSTAPEGVAGAELAATGTGAQADPDLSLRTGPGSPPAPGDGDPEVEPIVASVVSALDTPAEVPVTLLAPEAQPTVPPAATLRELIAQLGDDGWPEAMRGLIGVWGKQPPAAGTDLCVWARAQKLSCYSQSASWPSLLALGLPAVLRLEAPRNTAVFALVQELAADHARISLAGRTQRIERVELERLWQGDYLVLWQPPFENMSPLELGQSGERVRWLGETLAAIDGRQRPSHGTAKFDTRMLEQVKNFQRRHELSVDGIVGPQTLLHLTRKAAAESMPARTAHAGGKLALSFKNSL